MAHHKNIRVHGRSVKRKRHRKTKREREARKEKAAMLARIQILIDKAEHDMAAMIGANLYKQKDGFTQEQLYTYGGRNDSVFTLSFKPGTDSYQKYGDSPTVSFIYTRDERKALEEDPSAFNNEAFIKARLLVPCKNQRENAAELLLREGINPHDIEQITVLPSSDENNTFQSKEKRTLNVIDVPFKPYGKGRDIGWIYGFMRRKKAVGIGFMPDDEDLYTAYRFIFDKDKMSEEERQKVFDKSGHVVMSNVGYHYLKWCEEAGVLKEQDKELLRELRRRRVRERFEILKDALKRAGISFNLFRSKYKDQALFFIEKLFTFHDKSFNILGKHPLYMDFQSFVHIYMGHVEDVNMGNQLSQKDKFQLYEKDVIHMIDHIMHDLEKDYQQFRDDNPDKKYRRTGNNAFYCLGDYYEVFVDKDGRLESFYKASRDGKKRLKEKTDGDNIGKE